MGCIEELYTVSRRVDLSTKKNGMIFYTSTVYLYSVHIINVSVCQMPGHTAPWDHFLEELLGLIVQQKRFILSDKQYLESFMASLLSSSCNSLLVPQNIVQRYVVYAVNAVLHFLKKRRTYCEQ